MDDSPTGGDKGIISREWIFEFVIKIQPPDDLHKDGSQMKEIMNTDEYTISEIDDGNNDTFHVEFPVKFDNPVDEECAKKEKEKRAERFERCLCIMGYQLPEFNYVGFHYKKPDNNWGLIKKLYSRYSIGGYTPSFRKDIPNIANLLNKMKDDDHLDDLGKHLIGKDPNIVFVSNWMWFSSVYKKHKDGEQYPCRKPKDKKSELDYFKKYLKDLDDGYVELLSEENKVLFEQLYDDHILCKKGNNCKHTLTFEEKKAWIIDATCHAYEIRNSLVHENKLPDVFVKNGKLSEEKMRLLSKFVFDLSHIKTIKDNGLNQQKFCGVHRDLK